MLMLEAQEVAKKRAFLKTKLTIWDINVDENSNLKISATIKNCN